MRLDNNEIAIIAPQIIVDEFNRNKERVISDAGKSLSSHFNKVKEVIRHYAAEDQKDMILNHLNDLDHKVAFGGDAPFYTAVRVDKLLSKAEIIEITDSVKLRAAQRAIDKRAPFHLPKNSIGDAIIIEAYLDYKLMNASQDFKFMFITHNKSDFSVQNGNQKKPHRDIASLFDSSNSFYFISLPEALNSINPELVEEFEVYEDWHSEPRTFTEMIEMDNELTQKIWYNRHQVLAHKIKTGEIKIIKREDFTIENSPRTIVKDIWEGAKAAAKQVEKKYGKKNLSGDDFEWGMINGKLSAIRWALGDDWDMLDT